MDVAAPVMERLINLSDSGIWTAMDLDNRTATYCMLRYVIPLGLGPTL